MKFCKLIDLDYEDYRIGPSATSLILHGATGIVQCTRYDVNSRKSSEINQWYHSICI